MKIVSLGAGKYAIDSATLAKIAKRENNERIAALKADTSKIEEIVNRTAEQLGLNDVEKSKLRYRWNRNTEQYEITTWTKQSVIAMRDNRLAKENFKTKFLEDNPDLTAIEIKELKIFKKGDNVFIDKVSKERINKRRARQMREARQAYNPNFSENEWSKLNVEYNPDTGKFEVVEDKTSRTITKENNLRLLDEEQQKLDEKIRIAKERQIDIAYAALIDVVRLPNGESVLKDGFDFSDIEEKNRDLQNKLKDNIATSNDFNDEDKALLKTEFVDGQWQVSEESLTNAKANKSTRLSTASQELITAEKNKLKELGFTDEEIAKITFTEDGKGGFTFTGLETAQEDKKSRLFNQSQSAIAAEKERLKKEFKLTDGELALIQFLSDGKGGFTELSGRAQALEDKQSRMETAKETLRKKTQLDFGLTDEEAANLNLGYNEDRMAATIIIDDNYRAATQAAVARKQAAEAGEIEVLRNNIAKELGLTVDEAALLEIEYGENGPKLVSSELAESQMKERLDKVALDKLIAKQEEKIKKQKEELLKFIETNIPPKKPRGQQTVPGKPFLTMGPLVSEPAKPRGPGVGLIGPQREAIEKSKAAILQDINDALSKKEKDDLLADLEELLEQKAKRDILADIDKAMKEKQEDPFGEPNRPRLPKTSLDLLAAIDAAQAAKEADPFGEPNRVRLPKRLQDILDAIDAAQAEKEADPFGEPNRPRLPKRLQDILDDLDKAQEEKEADPDGEPNRPRKPQKPKPDFGPRKPGDPKPDPDPDPPKDPDPPLTPEEEEKKLKEILNKTLKSPRKFFRTFGSFGGRYTRSLLEDEEFINGLKRKLGQ